MLARMPSHQLDSAQGPDPRFGHHSYLVQAMHIEPLTHSTDEFILTTTRLLQYSLSALRLTHFVPTHYR